MRQIILGCLAGYGVLFRELLYEEIRNGAVIYTRFDVNFHIFAIYWKFPRLFYQDVTADYFQINPPTFGISNLLVTRLIGTIMLISKL